MTQYEKELKTQYDGNQILIDRLKGQIPSLLAIRGGQLCIDPECVNEAVDLEKYDKQLRATNAKMRAAIAKVKEITIHELDMPYTHTALIEARSQYDQQKIDAERDLQILMRRLNSQTYANFQASPNVVDYKGVFHPGADPVKEMKGKEQELEKRIKELEKDIEKINKVIAKVEPILQDSLR